MSIQFRILPHVVRAPLNTFAGSDGEWFCIKVLEGKAELIPADLRSETDFKNRVEFEVESEAVKELLRGEITVAQALLADRLIAGGVLAHWAATLIHLTQARDRPTAFLPSGHIKGFLQ
jgi:hypothetical protein